MAQAPLRCDICQSDEDVKFVCINCEEVLCSQCKIYHLRGKRTRNDEVVLLSEARQASTGKSPVILCDKHPKQDISLYCHKCDDFICTECLAGSHNTHSVKTLQDIKSTKTNELKGQLKALTDRTSIYDVALDNEGKAHNRTTQSIEQCKKGVLDQKTKLFAEVTSLCDEQLAELCLIQEQENDRYACACDSIQKQKLAVTAAKEEIQQGMDSGNPVTIMKASKDAEKFIQREEDPPLPVTKITRFQGGAINRPAVSPLQGKVSIEEKEHAIRSGQNKAPQDNMQYVKKQDLLPQQQVPSGAQIQQKGTVSRPVEMSKVDKYKVTGKIKINREKMSSFGSIKAIITVKDVMWVVVDGDKHLILIDKKGEIINESATVGAQISDAKAYNNEVLVTCINRCTVFKLSEDAKIKTVFSDLSPFHTNGLCVLNDMEVIVCLKHPDNKSSKVVRLGPTGNFLQTIQYEETATELKVEPYRVTSLQSGEVVITYKSRLDNKVVCTDRDGRHLFTWSGEVGVRGFGKFEPWYIIHDQFNKLFITDCWNDRVYALNIDGSGAKCILDRSKGIGGPFGLAMNEEGRLLLGCRKGTLYIIEY